MTHVALAVRRWVGFYVWFLVSREMDASRGSMELLCKGRSGPLRIIGAR